LVYEKYLFLNCACFPLKINEAKSVELLGVLAGYLGLFRTKGHT
jgi:hypothetical protein